MEAPDGQYVNLITTVSATNATIYQVVDPGVSARVFVIIHCTCQLFTDQLTSTLIATPVHTNLDTTDATQEPISQHLKMKILKLEQLSKEFSTHMLIMVHGLLTHGGETGGVVTAITHGEKDTVAVDVVDVHTMQVVAEVDVEVADITVWDEMLDSVSVVVLVVVFKLTIVKIK